MSHAESAEFAELTERKATCRLIAILIIDFVESAISACNI